MRSIGFSARPLAADACDAISLPCLPRRRAASVRPPRRSPQRPGPLLANAAAVVHARPPSRCGTTNRLDRARPLTARRARGEQVGPATSPGVSRCFSHVPSAFTGRAVPLKSCQPPSHPAPAFTRRPRSDRHPGPSSRASRSPLRFLAPRAPVDGCRVFVGSAARAGLSWPVSILLGRRSGPTPRAVIAAWPVRQSRRPGDARGIRARPSQPYSEVAGDAGFVLPVASRPPAVSPDAPPAASLISRRPRRFGRAGDHRSRRSRLLGFNPASAAEPSLIATAGPA